MGKAYWIAAYHSVTDNDKLAAYAKLALPAIEAGGGRFLARGTAAKAYEAGLVQRTVLIEFDSVAAAEKPTTARPIRRRWPRSMAAPYATCVLSKASEPNQERF